MAVMAVMDRYCENKGVFDKDVQSCFDLVQANNENLGICESKYIYIFLVLNVQCYSS